MNGINLAPPQAKRGKRANSSTLLFLAVRGKPKKRESWFAWVAKLFFALVGPLAPLASSIKKKLNFFLYCGMVDYGLGASQANKQSKEANEN